MSGWETKQKKTKKKHHLERKQQASPASYYHMLMHPSPFPPWKTGLNFLSRQRGRPYAASGPEKDHICVLGRVHGSGCGTAAGPVGYLKAL